MRIVIIGIGNVAYSLVYSIKNRIEYGAEEINLSGVYGRNAEKLRSFEESFGINPYYRPEDITPDADLYIICTADKGIAATAQMLRNVRGTVIHMSGSTDIKVLQDIFPNCGVMYPLQTFSAAKTVEFAKVPLYLEYSNDTAREVLEQFAGIMSGNVSYMNSHQRKTMHMCAVFACNFVNHSIAAAQALLHEAGLDPRMLDPLVAETIDKAMEYDPVLSQTGPAARNDNAIMGMHQEMLQDHPTLRTIYRYMSYSIQEFKEKYRYGIPG